MQIILSISHVPENVTIFICLGYMDFCNSDLFCNPKYDKLHII